MKTACMVAACILLNSSLVPAASGVEVRHSDQADFAVAYKLNPAHTGSITLSTGFPVPLRQLWTRDIVYSVGNPMIADDSIFFRAGVKYLFSLKLSSGNRNWVKTMATDIGEIAYDNGKLFGVTDDANLTGFAAASGKALWSTPLPDEWDFYVPPIAVNGQVFVTGAGHGGQLYAVDQTDGTLQWEAPIEAPQGSPAYGDKGVYILNNCNYYKFRPVNGSVIWHQHTGNESGGGLATPVYFRHRLFVEDDDVCGGDTVRDSRTGEQVGTFFDFSRPMTVFSDSKGRDLAVGLTETNTGWELWCWKARGGALLWTFKGDTQLQGETIVVNGTIFIGSGSGMLYALDERGKKIWSAQTASAVTRLAAGLGTLVVVGGSTVTAFAPQ